MKRTICILEGAGKGEVIQLTAPFLTLGRSKSAAIQIDDLQVSARHLEMRIAQDRMYVEDKSSNGTLLNGKRLVGAVSLNSGDILTVGQTKLRYEEHPVGAEKPVDPRTEDDISQSGEAEHSDSSSAFVTMAVAKLDKELRNAEPDGTRAFVEDGTRIQEEKELPGWKPPPTKDKVSTNKVLWQLGTTVCVSLIGIGVFWIIQHRKSSSAKEMELYSDKEYHFEIEYPSNWKSSSGSLDVLRSWGIGEEGSRDWTRVSIYAKKSHQNELTGLTHGFELHKETLKSRYKGFELIGYKPMTVNDIVVIYFGFTGMGVEGKGFYMLNGEKCISVECCSSQLCYKERTSIFSSILESFCLQPGSIQRFIDFPLADAGMQQLALSNPAQLAHQIQEHIRIGQALVKNEDVKPDNLFNAVQEYRRACQMSLAGPERQPAYQTAAQGLRKATVRYNQALERQRFEIKRALGEGDQRTAYWEANKMLQMVPDKTDDAYHEAFNYTKMLHIE